jgi:Superinfection immunity protein
MDNVTTIIFWAFMLVSYWAPTIVVFLRNTSGTGVSVNVGPVAVVNGFLGWTGLGWVVALAMAFGGRNDRAPAVAYVDALPAPVASTRVSV